MIKLPAGKTPTGKDRGQSFNNKQVKAQQRLKHQLVKPHGSSTTYLPRELRYGVDLHLKEIQDGGVFFSQWDRSIADAPILDSIENFAKCCESEYTRGPNDQRPKKQKHNVAPMEMGEIDW